MPPQSTPPGSVRPLLPARTCTEGGRAGRSRGNKGKEEQRKFEPRGRPRSALPPSATEPPADPSVPHPAPRRLVLPPRSNRPAPGFPLTRAPAASSAPFPHTLSESARTRTRPPAPPSAAGLIGCRARARCSGRGPGASARGGVGVRDARARRQRLHFCSGGGGRSGGGRGCAGSVRRSARRGEKGQKEERERSGRAAGSVGRAHDSVSGRCPPPAPRPAAAGAAVTDRPAARAPRQPESSARR